MSGSVNKCLLLGNLTRDPEIRTTQSGDRVANLSLATNESWKDKTTGERREKAEFHRVVIFNDRLVDVAEKYLKKGAKVYLEGSLQTRRWTDQSGAEKYTVEVVLQKYRGELTMLDTRGGGGKDESENQDRGGGSQQQSGAGYGSGGADLSDEVPFAPSFF
jgi:single-strand DNA-binding protein